MTFNIYTDDNKVYGPYGSLPLAQKLSARLDGETISIRALPGTLDAGMVLRGKYEHQMNKGWFYFTYTANGHKAHLARNEWEVI